MATTTIEQEILDLENQYWRAIRDGDVEAATTTGAAPCTPNPSLVIRSAATGADRLGSPSQ